MRLRAARKRGLYAKFLACLEKRERSLPLLYEASACALLAATFLRSKKLRNIRYNGINRSGNKMVIAIVVTGYLASAAEYYYRYVRGKRIKREREKKKEGRGGKRRRS